MSHKFEYNAKTIGQLESVLGRLKYSIRPSILVKWLENFNEDEIPTAINLLRYFEYIDSNELLLRLDHLLKELISRIGNNEDLVLFVPFAKYGKSSTLITYPITHLERFKKNEKRFLISNDIEKILKEQEVKHIVFIDDFVGSGKTFIEEYNKIKLFISSQKQTYLMCPIIMEQAQEKIHSEISNINVISEIRFRFLESELSPLKYSISKDQIEELLVNYGNTIKVNRWPNLYCPRGFKNSESLISFFYRTPNNTFPIIWGDDNWEPLYPRTNKSIIKQAKFLKKDVSYFLNTFLNTDFEVEFKAELIDDKDDKRSTQTILSNKNNFLLLSILLLKFKTTLDIEKTNLFICNYLGLTKEELRLIYIEGKNKGYLSKSTLELTDKSIQLLNSLFVNRKKTSIRKINAQNLGFEYKIFMPNSFRGKT